MILIIVVIFSGAFAVADSPPTANSDPQTSAQSIIGALDYVAIDYPEAVQAGAVINTAEYAEQREFLATVNELLLSLPPQPERQALLSQAQGLASLVDGYAPSDQVASGARRLTAALIEAYDVITAPIVAPVPASVAPLYAEQCAACHGASGRGDGLAGTALEPAPTDFHDTERARQRSVYGLYSTLTLGVVGTGMPSFSSLTEDQRWALAFYVAGLRDEPGVIAQGERLWNSGELREALPTLASFTSRTPAVIDADRETISPVLAYLRHHPEALVTSSEDPIQRTINGLRDLVSAYNNDQAQTASQLALSAYLEGYELIEATLRTLDHDLAIGIERDMQVLRNMIRERVPADELASSAANLEVRLQEASALLSASGSSTATLFTSAFLILLREGLEAILLLAAMSLYLRRTEHTTAMRYLHLGWLGALTAGALTWIGIKTVISISGAQREVIEGTAAFLAAFVLLYVGIWLHRHSNAVHWQAFLNERLGKSLSTGTLWGIAALSFIAVYREILETVLFYETLWLQSGVAVPLVFGASLAALALVIIGWIVFRVGARLPLRRFFQANAVLMFALALIFVGKGVVALQEAGWIYVTFVSAPRIDWLGIYPTAQSIGAQLAIVCIGTISLAVLSRRKTTTLQ
jgi:high-affinity iron transporter